MKKTNVLFKNFLTRRVVAGFIALFLIIPFLLTSCWKERFDFDNLSTPDTWNPDVCAPVVHSKMTLKDVLNDWDRDNLFEEDETGFLYLVYWNRIFSQTAGEMLAIPGQSFPVQLSLDINGPVLGGDTTLPTVIKQHSVTMPGGEILDLAVLNENNGFSNGGTMILFITSSLNADATINVKIPEAKLNGISLNQDIYYTQGQQLTGVIDLSGYTIAFDNTSPYVNNLDIHYTVTVHGNNTPIISPYVLNINGSFQNLSFHELYGDFKQHPIMMPDDTINIKIFDNNIYGAMYFEDPRVYFWAYNSCGIPIGVSLNNFKAVSAVNFPYEVELWGYPNPWIINAPSMSEIGQVIVSSDSIDKSNSNIKDAANISPTDFLANVTATANPAGGPAANFVIDTSRLSVDVQVELPLYGKAWDFRVADTLEFEFGDDFDLDQVEFVLMRFNIENHFPVDAVVQAYFLDENDVILDSLITPPELIVTAAPVGLGPEYRVTSSTFKRTETRIEQPRISRLKPTTKIVFLGKMATISSGTELVKIYSDYYLDVRLAVRAGFNITINY